MNNLPRDCVSGRIKNWIWGISIRSDWEAKPRIEIIDGLLEGNKQAHCQVNNASESTLQEILACPGYPSLIHPRRLQPVYSSSFPATMTYGLTSDADSEEAVVKDIVFKEAGNSLLMGLDPRQ